MGGWGSAHYNIVNIVDVRNILPTYGGDCLDFISSTVSEPINTEYKNEFLSRKNSIKVAAGLFYPIWPIF